MVVDEEARIRERVGPPPPNRIEQLGRDWAYITAESGDLCDSQSSLIVWLRPLNQTNDIISIGYYSLFSGLDQGHRTC